MDFINLRALLGFGFILTIIPVSASDVPPVVDLSVSISDEEVLLYWKHPADDSSSFSYNVQMKKYVGKEWKNVDSCIGIDNNICDLTSYIENYRTIYKVRVQTVRNESVSDWKTEKVAPYDSKLNPPYFNLWATSSTLTIHILSKPILKKIFAFGVTYTIHLMEREQEDKNVTVYLEDVDGNEQMVKTFSSLKWGVEYCISVRVEGKGGCLPSGFSPQHCQRLPEQEWFLIAVSSLTTVGVLMAWIIIVIILMCYLKRPHQTPAVLKSPVSGWHPLSVAEARIEVVTDKGWFISGDRAQEEISCDLETLPLEKADDNDDEESRRRRSLDSGVCMESSADKRRQEDSGCETSSETVFTLTGETDLRKGLGGVWLSGPSTEEGSYRSQKPSPRQTFGQIVPDLTSHLTSVVSGYRSDPGVCLCSGAGQCTWCLKQRLNSCNKQLLLVTPHFPHLDSWTDMTNVRESFFPMLTSLCSQKDMNMNDVSLSICDL